MGATASRFGKNLKARGGVGLFFYAGHAVEVAGENFLIPIKADIQSEDEIRFKAISANFILSKMDSAKNPVNMVFLDACRNNPFAKSFRSARRGLAQMDAPKGSLIVYATAPGDVASDGNRRNGIFTKNLLANIKNSGQDVVLMLRDVRIGVLQDTNNKQTPWTASSLRGSFSFNPLAGKGVVKSTVASGYSTYNADRGQSEKWDPQAFWSPLDTDETQIEEIFENGRIHLIGVSSGKSSSADSVSRRIFAKKSALKNIESILMKGLRKAPYNFSRSAIKRIMNFGKITDLVYDSGKVQLEWELVFSPQLSQKIRSTAVQ